MKKICLALLLCLPLTAVAQNSTEGNDSRYLAGAVTKGEGGFVTFCGNYHAEGKSRSELLSALSAYVDKHLVNGPDHLERARITEVDAAAGLLAANIEEYLYFKRKAWTMDRVRFSYQLIYRITDGGYSVEMRNLRYQYDDVANAETLRAEDWITDEEALNKSRTRLTRIGGKFRRFTIDRKDDVFRASAVSAEAVAVQ